MDKKWWQHPAVIVSVVVVVLIIGLWFKGGEFFCRMRGGTWAKTYGGHSVCFTP